METSSPLCGFPRACGDLVEKLDPNVHPVATPPVLCWICGAGFLSWADFFRHCTSTHGDWAEYRKHLFWRAQKLGFLPLLPWQKRHLLANFAFHQCYSIPENGSIDWTGRQSIQTAVPRQEVGCAVCARKDWIERRFRVYLWRRPDSNDSFQKEDDSAEPRNASATEELGDSAAKVVLLESNEETMKTRTMNNGCYCFGSATKINELLATGRYQSLMPNIPSEELYASSIQHPDYPEMSWLLHTARVPRLTSEQATAFGFTGQPISVAKHDSQEINVVKPDSPQIGVTKPDNENTTHLDATDQTKIFDSRCAGVGDKDATAWCCMTCISSLCTRDEDIKMPPPALANLLWLGREHPLCKKASVGTRMLSCLGRPVWRKLILGKGASEESEKGITGNFIFLAQARLPDIGASLPPRVEELQESFVVLFSKSIDDVKKARALVVQRDDYLALIRLRRRVCQVYAEVEVNEEQVNRFPEKGVPEELIACAQYLPEAANAKVAHVGPGTREVDVACNAHGVACNAHGAAKPVETDSADADDWEEMNTNTVDAAEPTEAERSRMEFETNTAEDIIAVDHASEPGVLETFAAFQTKLQALSMAAGRVIAAERQQDLQTDVSVAKPNDASSSVAKPDDTSAVNAACAVAAEKEECRVLVLETQELAKHVWKSSTQLKKITEDRLEHDKACVSLSGKPLSMTHPDTWPRCFLEFFYGDAVPNMDQRGDPKNGSKTVHVDIAELCSWLQDREELEYTLPSEKKPYKARATSRFDTPEFTAIFGCVKRHEQILKGVNATFRRQGYEADLKLIATSKTADCVEVLCHGHKATPASAAKSGRQRGLEELGYAADVPQNLQRAVRQVLFSTVQVPFTDGYRRNLRHEGHNLNAIHGPLKIFMTANFADVYSPVFFHDTGRR
jgi:hypothetical protein